MLVLDRKCGFDAGAADAFGRKMAGFLDDTLLTVKQAHPGSDTIVLESSRDAFQRIHQLMTMGRPVDVAGFVIQDVYSRAVPPTQPFHVQEIPSEVEFRPPTSPSFPRIPLPPDLPIEFPGDDARLAAIHEEQLRQAKLSFNCALPLGILGILVAIWGAASWSQGQGKSLVGISAIMTLLTFVLLKFPYEMNRRLEEARNEVMAKRREDGMFLKILQIADAAKRDEAILQFQQAVLMRAALPPARRRAKNK